MNVNGSCAGAVVNEYFHKHFHNAIITANETRAQGKRQWVVPDVPCPSYAFSARTSHAVRTAEPAGTQTHMHVRAPGPRQVPLDDAQLAD